MKTLNEILDLNRSVDNIVTDLKDKAIIVPDWDKLKYEYDPNLHEIMTDTVTRKDKKDAEGNIEKAARVIYGQQKLYARRMTQMAFAIPVQRIYDTGNDKTKQQIADALEAIYQKARIDAVNNKRMKAYFSACEMITIWYAVKGEEHQDYGFETEFKLRCKSYSPMDTKFSRIEQADLYPYFDEYGDMIAMSLEYTRKVNDISVKYFETYTADRHYLWKQEESDWELVNKPEAIAIAKIQGAYIWRPMPIWESTTNNTKEIEYTLSRESDILRKNSAPIIAVVGEMVDDKPAGDKAREVYQLKGAGSINYVTWTQQVDAMKFYIDELKKNTDEELQLPNLSMENIKGLGAISGEARKTLLTDAHLKVGDESGEIIEFLDREFNVIKAFLAIMNKQWAEPLKSLTCKHVISPFIQNDEGTEIDNISKATQKPFASQKEAIRRLGWVKPSEVDAELEQIQAEETAANAVTTFPVAGE